MDVFEGFPFDEEFFTPLSSTEVYDTERDQWSVRSDAPHGHQRATTFVLSDGRLLVVGDIESSVASLYDPVADEWTSVGSASRTGVNLSIAEAVSGELIIAGGRPASWLDVLDPSTAGWSRLDLPMGMSNAGTITAINDAEFLVTGTGTVDAAILRRTTISRRTLFLPYGLRD